MRDRETADAADLEFRRKPAQMFAPCVAILYLCLATFSVQYEPIRSGLDTSWQYGLNYLANSDYVFGRDVIFTYGPLGYLSHPMPVGEDIRAAIAFVAGLQAAIALGLFAFLFQFGNRPRFWLTLGGITIAGAFGLWEEYYYQTVLGVCLLASLVEGPLFVPLCALSGALGALLLMTKFTTTVGVTGMLAVWALLLLRRPLARAAKQRLATLAIAFGCVSTVCIWHFFHGPGAFVSWLSYSYDISTGYGAAMSIAGPPLEIGAGILLLLLLIGVGVWRRDAFGPVLLLLAAPVLLAFRHAFVGQSTMAAGYVTFLAAVAALLFLFARDPRDFAAARVAFCLLATMAYLEGAVFQPTPSLSADGVWRYLTLGAGLTQLRNVLQPARLKAELDHELTDLLAGLTLPPAWLEELRGGTNGTDIFPWELTYAAANRLVWRPSFVLQQYSAYTARLDRRVAATLEGPHAASHIMYQFAGLFGRVALLDDPASFRSLLRNYSPSAVNLAGNLLLLRRTAGAAGRAESLRTVNEATGHTGRWLDVPMRPELLYACVDLRPNLEGVARKLFWKMSPVLLRVSYSSGATGEYRILPDTAQNCLPINYLPASLRDLYDLFRGSAYDRVTRFQIAGAGASAFQNEFRVRFAYEGQPIAYFSGQNGRGEPQIVRVTTEAAHGRAVTLAATAREPAGYRNLQFVQVIVNQSQDGRHACYLNYEINRDILWLIADDGAGAAGYGRPGTAEILENGRCRVDLYDTDVTAEGPELTVRVPVAMKPDASDNYAVFAAALGGNGGTSGWRPQGNLRLSNATEAAAWTFPRLPPEIQLAVSPDRGQRVQLGVRATDLNGLDDLAFAEVIVNESQTGVEGCYLHYRAKARELDLIDDSGAALAGVLRIGSDNRISNSYCAVEGQGTTAVENSQGVTLSIALTLSPKMRWKRMIFASVVDKTGLRRDWKAFATLPAPSN